MNNRELIAEYFDNVVTQKINDEHQEIPKLIKYGYGHSLGGNNFSILQIMSKDYTNIKYDQVYVINDAPPTAYQLSNIEEQFFNELYINFDFTNYDDIYTIPPDELKTFTKEYYNFKNFIVSTWKNIKIMECSRKSKGATLMRSWLIYSLFLTLVFTGGCSIKKEIDIKELPNTAAFQDEFTRSLLDSPEEVEHGHYLFESKTGGYSMLWPKNAVTDGPPFYQRNKDGFEKILFSEIDEEENYSYAFSTTYTTYGDSLIETNLNMLSASVGYNGDYDKIETDKTIIYYAKLEDKIGTENESITSYNYFSYIVSKDSKKGIEYIFTANCFDELNRVCNIDPKVEEEKALIQMKNVTFRTDG
ncbi:DUF6792 domain-containing protein [Metabacillus litoralis]|uniref:DUF6792 domain-containing protein n=1 Tax=Metabacillus litoralis TaxID=152268 RepID=UPI00203F9A9B|nr:DUF6792 domain-containing protein [Metabacillus litoralis]MCM3163295.1 hypothetical protein [Metabacillus litoralis]